MRLYLFIIGFLSIVVFLGCDDEKFYLMQRGTFHDSRVMGLDYSCGDKSGVTDAKGEFECRSDSSKIEFSIGSILLGSVDISKIKDFNIYPSDLIGIDRNNTQNKKLIVLLQLLQSLDSDENPNNGIVIDSRTREKLSKVKSVGSLTQQKLEDILKEIGITPLKGDYAIAHYEDTLRNELNLSVDTVAPAPAKLISKIMPNQNKTPIIITGEIGAKVFIDGIDSSLTIDKNHTAQIDLNLSSKVDGRVTFVITLKDVLNQMSDELNITLINDTISPIKPTVSTYPRFINGSSGHQNAITIIVSGEDNTHVLLNSKDMGVISKGVLSIKLDTTGKDGVKKFTIVLVDEAGNRSPSLTLLITKDTTVPPKPIVTSLSNLVDGNLTISVKGEVGSEVYVGNVLYGMIGTSGSLTVQLSNPNQSYYEEFIVKLVDSAGNSSDIFSFVTSFNRTQLNSSTTYYVPQNLTVVKNASSSDEVIIMGYEQNEVVSGVVSQISLNAQETLTDGFNRVISMISSSSNVSSFIKLTESTSAQSGIVAEYTLRNNITIGSIDLMTLLINTIYGGQLSNLPLSDASAVTSDYFNIVFHFSQVSTGEAYLTFSIVPNHLSLQYQTIISSINNTDNIKSNSVTVLNRQELFEVNASNQQKSADFLFVIDDSGSMSSYQSAVSQASQDFANAIGNAGINFRAGIITTGESINSTNSYGASRVLSSVGLIENDINLFKEKIVVGTDGSGTETAIYNAEQALQSVALGDSSDGRVTALGMPTSKTPLSVIILSDEESQYYSRAGSTFDVTNNLFVKRGYTVYSIVNSYVANYSQYDDLAQQTGGLVADISNTSNYNTIMNAIAQKSIGTTGYKLVKKGVIESTIYVTIDGVEVPHSNQDGWRYVASSNSVIFYGTTIPQIGQKIVINYSYSK
jgi:hypothetical protein